MGKITADVIDKDKGWAEFFKHMGKQGSAHVNVGVLDDADGNAIHHGKLTVKDVATINEFGSADKHVPARSFVRSTCDEQREPLAELMTQLTKDLVFTRTNVREMLKIIGELLVAEMQQKILQGMQPDNADSTKLRKARKKRPGVKGSTAKFFARPARTLGEALAQVGALAAVRPLIDTKKMFRAIKYRVVPEVTAIREMLP